MAKETIDLRPYTKKLYEAINREQANEIEDIALDLQDECEEKGEDTWEWKKQLFQHRFTEEDGPRFTDGYHPTPLILAMKNYSEESIKRLALEVLSGVAAYEVQLKMHYGEAYVDATDGYGSTYGGYARDYPYAMEKVIESFDVICGLHGQESPVGEPIRELVKERITFLDRVQDARAGRDVSSESVGKQYEEGARAEDELEGGSGGVDELHAPRSVSSSTSGKESEGEVGGSGGRGATWTEHVTGSGYGRGGRS